jgi:hypothetical protein
MIVTSSMSVQYARKMTEISAFFLSLGSGNKFLVVLVPKAGQAPLHFLVGVTLVSGQLLRLH